MPSTSLKKQQAREQRLLQARSLMLEGAGWGLAKQQKLLRKALNRTAQALDAMKGEEPDWQARLRAAEQVKDLTGVDLSRQGTSEGQSNISIHLNMPWFRPATTISSGEQGIVDVTPPKPLIDQGS